MDHIPEAEDAYYAGSRLLDPISKASGLPLDQVNFLSCQLLEFILAFIFRIYLPPTKTSATTRHVVELSVGLTSLLFCFGSQTWILMAQSLSCLFVMKTFRPGLMEKICCFLSLGILCSSHVYRQIYDYGGYTMDITGPLMINTQRLSSLGFSMSDGACKDKSQLTENMKRRMVENPPTYTEFFSYLFSFHMILVGPFCFYNDYINFIEGRTEQPLGTINLLVLEKLVVCLCMGYVTIKILPHFSIKYLQDPEFVESNFFFKMYYIILCTSMTRTKYYFAWKMSEAINNNAGLAYNGLDKEGNPRWDISSNAKIRNVELSTSLKALIDNWNITTTYWLRHVVYDRVPRNKTFAVFAFSALWHGFYPGYYLTFLTATIFIAASRMVRRNIRPFFQESSPLRMLYELLTFSTNRVAVGYLTFPFVALVFWPSWETYKQLFFFCHIFAALIIIGLTIMPTRHGRSKSKVKDVSRSKVEENGSKSINGPQGDNASNSLKQD